MSTSAVHVREAQRRRTRNAIVAAAADLLSRGRTPSVVDVARAADVSRRTVYMYFPTLERLLVDATAGILGREDGVERIFNDGRSRNATERIDALSRILLKADDDTLALGRRLIALTIESPKRASSGATRRSRRRIAWIELALAPIRDRVTREQFDRLVSGLAILLGWEAMIVLRDVRGLTPLQESRVIRWAATALVDAILRERRHR